MYYLSFPDLGIKPFHIDKVAFTIFGHDIAWYGILITLGMIIAVIYALHLAKFEKISSDDIIDLALCVIVFGVIGARLYYVLFSLDKINYLVSDGNFWHNLWKTFVNVIAIWEGGLAIYGGIIAGLISACVFAKVKKIDMLKIFDILVPCVLIGQIIGRWGNFINVEAYGGETDSIFRMGILYSFSGTGVETGIWDIEKYVHPTFLYESVWNLIGLIFVFIFYKKKKFNGQMFCSYLIWYGFGRMLIEGLRTDSLYLGPIRISQLVGLVSCIAGVVLLAILSKKALKKRKECEKYTEAFDVDGKKVLSGVSVNAETNHDKNITTEEKQENGTLDYEKNETDSDNNREEK